MRKSQLLTNDIPTRNLHNSIIVFSNYARLQLQEVLSQPWANNTTIYYFLTRRNFFRNAYNKTLKLFLPEVDLIKPCLLVIKTTHSRCDCINNAFICKELVLVLWKRTLREIIAQRPFRSKLFYWCGLADKTGEHRKRETASKVLVNLNKMLMAQSWKSFTEQLQQEYFIADLQK